MFKVLCFYQKVHNFLLCRPTITGPLLLGLPTLNKNSKKAEKGLNKIIIIGHSTNKTVTCILIFSYFNLIKALLFIPIEQILHKLASVMII